MIQKFEQQPTEPGSEKDNSAETAEAKELLYIQDYLEEYRKENAIVPTRESKFETSCTAYPGGDVAHLLERQLATTVYGSGCWGEVMGDTGATLRKKIIELIQQMKNYHD